MIDDKIEQIIHEESANAEAIRSLINVKDRRKGKNSDVELKTDFINEEQLINHTKGAVIGRVLEMNKSDFAKSNFFMELIETKERKSISRNRLSRREIVELSRVPDPPALFDVPPVEQKQGFFKKLFTPKQKEGIQ